MVIEDARMNAIIAAQFKRFREDTMFLFRNTDEELDSAAGQLGVRSLADLRTVVVFHFFMNTIEQSVRWN